MDVELDSHNKSKSVSGIIGFNKKHRTIYSFINVSMFVLADKRKKNSEVFQSFSLKE